MLLPKPIRKLLGVFRGNISPAMIILSVVCGCWFGLTPGWTGIHTLLLVIALVVNINLALFVITAAIGRGLVYAAAPVFYYVGQFVHDYLGFLLRLLAKIPIAAMTDFSRYSVAAAVLLGPVTGLILGFLLSRAVMGFRRKWLALETNSEAFKKWYEKKWVRILDKILLGKSAKDAKAALEGKYPVIRKVGVVFAVIVLVIALGAGMYAEDRVVKGYATESLSEANGAEVNLAGIDLKPFAGSLSAEGIEVTDPEKPTHNRVVVESLKADAGIGPLLWGKVVIDDIELANVKFDQAREKPGKVFAKDETDEPVFDPNDYKVNEENISRLEKYLKSAEKVKAFLEKIRPYLPSSKDKGTRPEQLPESYLEYLKAGAERTPAARIIARRLAVEPIEIPVNFLGSSAVVMTNLNDAPEAAGLPVGINLKSRESEFELDMTCHYESFGKLPPVKGSFANLDISSLSSMMEGMPINFKSGTASGSFSGTVSQSEIDMTVDVSMKDVQASSGGALMGLDAKTADEVLGSVDNFKVTIRLFGPISEPRIVVDSGNLAEQLKNAAGSAVKKRVEKEINKKIEQELGDKAPEPVKEVLKDSNGLLEGIGGMFKRKD